MDFEWDEHKRKANIAKHGIDFRDVEAMFDDRVHLEIASPRAGEHRVLRIARLHGDICTVIWTARDDQVRIISVRKARDAEKRAYRTLLG